MFAGWLTLKEFLAHTADRFAILDVGDEHGGLGHVFHAPARSLDDLLHILEQLPGLRSRVTLADDFPLRVARGLPSHVKDAPGLDNDTVGIGLSGRFKNARWLVRYAFHARLLVVLPW